MHIKNISHINKSLSGTITLDGSKSISNRALIIMALANADPDEWLTNLSGSKDTVTLRHLLKNRHQPVLDAGDAGTTFRFLTAYLSLLPGERLLTGSHRMIERPVGPLVAGLNELGGVIKFSGQDGYPPLHITGTPLLGTSNNTVKVSAGASSQFLSALLLIGPCLPNGLVLVPDGRLVSKPYIDMTLGLMRHFSADADWAPDGQSIRVKPGGYTPKPLRVEADWSAASYWYAMAAFAPETDLHLHGLHPESWQGDSAIVAMMQKLGVQTQFTDSGIHLTKGHQSLPPVFEQDFLNCPDIAQSLAVICAGLGVKGLFSGLETLSIKETDRIGAIKSELKKVGVPFSKLPPHFSKKHPDRTYYITDGKAQWEYAPQFDTYGDHRMAMAFAPLAYFGDIQVENPDVVVKSYPQFWVDFDAKTIVTG